MNIWGTFRISDFLVKEVIKRANWNIKTGHDKLFAVIKLIKHKNNTCTWRKNQHCHFSKQGEINVFNIVFTTIKIVVLNTFDDVTGNKNCWWNMYQVKLINLNTV